MARARQMGENGKIKTWRRCVNSEEVAGVNSRQISRSFIKGDSAFMSRPSLYGQPDLLPSQPDYGRALALRTMASAYTELPRYLLAPKCAACCTTKRTR